MWKENIAVLAGSRTVYAVGLLGHGMSDKPGNIPYDDAAGGEFLERFMDALGIQRSSLIGNSAGGLIAGAFAFQYPDRVEKLVLVDSAGLGRSVAWFLRVTSLPLVGEFLHTFDFWNIRTLRKNVFYDSSPVDLEPMTELVASRKQPDSIKAALEGLRSGVNILGLKGKMNILAKLKDVSVPMLIIWGEEDRIVPVSHVRRAARELPQAKVHVFPRCGHWPQMEKADIFNQLVLSFLDEGLEGERGPAKKGAPEG